jgi:pimeloyl-ACP methyl ester carboxylesterase
VDLHVEQRGDAGPALLLVAGLGDPAEAWEPQLEGLADRYRVIAFDNRGAGRTPLPDTPITPASMADDAAAILGELDVPHAHVMGFSMGSAIAQELALRHPDLVDSLVLVSTYARADALFRAQLAFWRWMPEVAPGEREFFEAFFTWVYSPGAHDDGTVAEIVKEAMAFPHQQPVEAFQAQVDVCMAHDTVDRLSQIAAPTLVIAGEFDLIFPPRFGRFVADGIPNARFEVMPSQGHQPFQEIPDEFNELVDTFLAQVAHPG